MTSYGNIMKGGVMLMATPRDPKSMELCADIELKWHVLLCEPLNELKAARRLCDLGFSPYVPVIPGNTLVRVHTSFGVQRRERIFRRVMFPGYLFLPLNLTWEFGPIFTVDGLRVGQRWNLNPFLRVNGVHAIVSEDDMD